MFGHPFGYAKFVTLISAICMHESKSGARLGATIRVSIVSASHPQQNAQPQIQIPSHRYRDTDTAAAAAAERNTDTIATFIKCDGEANSTECRIQICVFLFDYAHSQAWSTLSANCCCTTYSPSPTTPCC